MNRFFVVACIAIICANAAAPTPTVVPAMVVDVKSSDITVGGKPFAQWFNTVFLPKAKKDIKLQPYFKYPVDEANFKKVFDQIPALTAKPAITLTEFIAHFAVIYNEHAGTFKSSSEGGGAAYCFQPKGRKVSYNGKFQRLCGDQLSNKPNGNDFGSYKKAGWGKLTKQVDIDAWNSKTVYPENPPAGSAFTPAQWEGIKIAARQCDFFKYRGRGLQQLTFRGNYAKHATPFLLKYYGKSAEDATNEQLDQWMQDPRIYVAAYHSYHTKKMDAIKMVNEVPPNWAGFATVQGGADYVPKFSTRCNALHTAITAVGYSAK